MVIANKRTRFAKAFSRALAALLAWASLGCSSGDAGPSDASVEASDGGGLACFACNDASFDGPPLILVRATLDQVCGNADGCHGGGAGNFGIRLGSEFTDMINVTSTENPPMKRVLPGDPENSYVYLKLLCEGGIVGQCMPGGDPHPATAKVFHDWIEAGAPTN